MTDRDERELALDRAVRALARSDHSSASLLARLERAGFSEHARESALAELVRAGYVDDERYARSRATHLATRGYGDEWIRGDLRAHGVSTEVVEQALGELEPEAARAREQAARLGQPARVARMLQRRGFSASSLESIFARIVADDP